MARNDGYNRIIFGCLKIVSGIRTPPPPRLLRLDAGFTCIEPSLFLKQNIPASGLAMFPKTGHVLNLEEPALFDETPERFLALAEADCWPPRDPASRRA